MKTVADFKRKMVVGAKVSTQLFWMNDGQLHQVNDIKDRTVTIHQSNSFAISMLKDGKEVDSWCNWPKKSEFTPLSENKAQVDFDGGRLIYEFIS
jgi:hypothetical protein